jgi:hypothetical protein
MIRLSQDLRIVSTQEEGGEDPKEEGEKVVTDER